MGRGSGIPEGDPAHLDCNSLDDPLLTYLAPVAGIGRRNGLKPCGLKSRVGSNPTGGTMKHQPSGACYYGKKCGNPECQERYRVRYREQQRKRRRPDSGWTDKRVDAKASREHIQFLSLNGVTMEALSNKLKMSRKHLSELRLGIVKYVHRSTEEKILACFLSEFPKSPKAAAWTRKAIDRANQKSEVA